jgi:hypothetical protein
MHVILPSRAALGGSARHPGSRKTGRDRYFAAGEMQMRGPVCPAD